MGYGNPKLLKKVDSRSRFSVIPAVQYDGKVTAGNSFIAQELLNFQEIDCLAQDDDIFNKISKIQFIYFPGIKYTINSFLRGYYEV